jgi:alkanesulfonate monooxygenase SsuD/methylene tetrahydromethanopterin reductase-like flavin-dependent oxidoreductase (luciferase family)
VARYADACNLFGSSPDEVVRKLDVLRGHCDAEGRDYEAIAKTALATQPVLEDTDAFLADARRYASLGITDVQVMPDRHPGHGPQRERPWQPNILPLAIPYSNRACSSRLLHATVSRTDDR